MVWFAFIWWTNVHLHELTCECDVDLRVRNKGNEVLVITEIMQNPTAVSDSNGEWFEIFNPNTTSVNLNGWTIKDNGSNNHTINTDLIIASGAYAVFGNNGDPSMNGGILVHYQYSNFTLGNGEDEIILVRPDQTVADEVVYDGGASWPDPTGKSMELQSAALDNNLGSNWSESTNLMANGDYGTPGSGPDSVVAVAAIITEIMQNPSAVSDTLGEWFEVHNPGPAALNLNGWTIRDNGSDSHLITADVWIPSNGFGVLGRNGNSASNGGITVDYQYSGITLSNGADEIVLLDADDNLIDEVEYDGGPAWPDPDGSSMELTGLTLDNQQASSWAAASALLPSGDRATPGQGPGSTGGGPNQAPVVWAGPDETVYLDSMTASTLLFGMASDADGDPLTHAWTQVSGGSGVSLSNPQVLRPVASFNAVGLFTFQLDSTDGTTSSQDTVTISVANRPTSTANYQIYFGNVHSHSSYSDGNKSNDPVSNGAQAAFRYARDLGGLDWLVVSDHNHATAGMDHADYANGVSEAASVNAESDDFVAIYGTEWGTISTGGHVIYSDSQLWGWESGNYDVFVAKGDYNALFGEIRNANTFGQLCHPGSDHFDNIFNVAYDAAWDDAVSAVSVKSGPAFATALDYSEASSSTYQSYFLNLLQKGYRVGPASDQDTHYDNWGLANQQRTAVLATDQTQAAILEGLRAGRIYASEDRNLEVDFWGNYLGQDYALASVVDVAVGDSITLNLMVADPDGEPLNQIELYAGDVGGATASVAQTSMTLNLTFSFSPGSVGQTRYFFGLVTQGDGQRAWTAPIWVRAVAASGPVTDSYSATIAGYQTQSYVFSTLGGAIEASASWNQSNRDLDLYLYNSSGTLVSDSESVSNPEVMNYTATTGGQYTLQVYNYSWRTTSYNLDIGYTP